MEKYGVLEKDEAAKEKTSEYVENNKNETCPRCGCQVEQHGKLRKCPSCGTQPFEESQS